MTSKKHLKKVSFLSRQWGSLYTTFVASASYEFLTNSITATVSLLISSSPRVRKIRARGRRISVPEFSLELFTIYLLIVFTQIINSLYSNIFNCTKHNKIWNWFYYYLKIYFLLNKIIFFYF